MEERNKIRQLNYAFRIVCLTGILRTWILVNAAFNSIADVRIHNTDYAQIQPILNCFFTYITNIKCLQKRLELKSRECKLDCESRKGEQIKIYSRNTSSWKITISKLSVASSNNKTLNQYAKKKSIASLIFYPPFFCPHILYTVAHISQPTVQL